MDIQPNRSLGSFVRPTHVSQTDHESNIDAGDQTRDRNGDGRMQDSPAQPQDECDLSTSRGQSQPTLTPKPERSSHSGDDGSTLDFNC